MATDRRRTVATEQQQAAEHQQAGGQPEALVADGAQHAEQQRPAQLAEGEAGAVQRHQPATPAFGGQLVDPALAEDEHHGQRDAEQQAQQQPQSVVLPDRQDGDRDGAEQQAELQTARRAAQPRQPAGQPRTEQHAHRRHRRHHADGERAVAPAFQAQRHQRQAEAEGQPDQHHRPGHRRVGCPTHHRSPCCPLLRRRKTVRPSPDDGNPAAAGADPNRPAARASRQASRQASACPFLPLTV
ncbi:hypothetical protein D3C81_1409740 [compost metagenome]